ncbi:hypothetical protein EAH89_17175 [Roseomonas nepalensis]|uniref:CI repressor n=1 Tax=Muricoccus nepalensis TaxID=1854500 RepID=A0A502FV38_9PROT|nr:hypothetical protein EAH89_17175 [Roseomonas nepalensis]
MTGMALLRSRRGAMARVAAALGLSRAAVCMWKEVPARHLPAVVETTGIAAAALRPDLAEMFKPAPVCGAPEVTVPSTEVAA